MLSGSNEIGFYWENGNEYAEITFDNSESYTFIYMKDKIPFIEENKDEILNHFKIEDKNGWKVKKGFVVNTLYVSAFYKEKVDFILIDDLGKFLQQDENL